MKTNSAAQPIYVAVLRDSVSGKQVEVPKDAKGRPDFFVAATRLRKLQDQTTPKTTPTPENPKLATAKNTFLKAKAEYFKDVKTYNLALTTYDKAKIETEKSKAAKAKPALVAKYEKAEDKAKKNFGKANLAVHTSGNRYDQARKDYEKELKASQKHAAYDHSTHVSSAFGKKFPGQFGAPQLVWIAKTESPKPTVVSKPKTAPTAKPKAPVKAAAAPTSPKPAKTATPATAISVAKKPSPPTPGSDKNHPIDYSLAEVTDGNVLIHTKSGETMKFAKADIQYQSQGNGLSSIKTPDGKTLWFRFVAPEEKSKPEPIAKSETPPPAPVTSATAKLTGVSDTEAADYQVAVPGYPCAKVPAHVWKHKSENKFLAVFDGKRVLLSEGQFLSLDQGAHPELYAKASPTSSPDF